MSARCTVTANYLRTVPELRRYFASVFLIEIDVADGGAIEDFMFPDWATLRFNAQPSIAGNTRAGEPLPNSRFIVSGPRSQEAYMHTASLRQWGVLLHPLGWSLLIGEPASAFANRLADGMTHPAFAAFRPLAATLYGAEPDREGELARLTDFFLGITPRAEPAEEAIMRAYHALDDPEVDSVDKLAERAGINRRTLERLCQRVFGFPPKLLLRRQRFLRSLSQFTADPSLKWVGALDAGYYDQAQFVRDFREFMGMTPSEYGQRCKPVVEPVLRERARYRSEWLRERQLGAYLPG
ncbi:helix-turn-helix domain-containing protein [Novosphingobium sp. 1949]|uniref:Helix-turn-helix domain-containing protein n=1 Tax=Novosphingobium organovorum TaxID=2930092 RepID=A0ABT0B9F6_9SPHN|nr:helix-turn-helix domain-containing protein [Novosphingobium organovorum]MCJ2181471.1 helix-turn-helix domain-containing protein [Novosphingobium organovorum]